MGSVSSKMSPPQSSYRELTRRILREAGAAGQPANGSFELTARCNLACRMCYVRHSHACEANSPPELSADQWAQLALEAVDAGMVFLLLTGGEPLLRPDFFDIYHRVAPLGVMLILFTNGTLVTKEVARRLAECPPSRTEVTLYGATEPTYEAVTGAPGGYRRCVAGIEHLLNAGLTLLVKSTVCALNVHEIDEMRGMADRWGVPFAVSPHLFGPRDGVESESCQLRLTPCQQADVEAQAWVDPPPAEDAGLAPPGSAFYCSAGTSSFIVSSTGEMGICNTLPLPRAQPLQVGFAEAWRQVREFALSIPPTPQCASCELRRYCGCCPGWSYSEMRRLDGAVPFLCELAKERAKRHRRPEAG